MTVVANHMVEKPQDGFIAVMDSGVGGISVLSALVSLLPFENFHYFGDSAFTPYGEKPFEWILERTSTLVDRFIDSGAKAIVIACNTATSAAAEPLREKYESIPIIGIEPALKPAACSLPGGRILVMATPMTLHLEKFQHLADQWSAGCTVIPLACDGLAGTIEKSGPESEAVYELLERLIGCYRGSVDGVVLGCTHYPLAAQPIRQILGNVPQFDGASGTARHLYHVLEDRDLLTCRKEPGQIDFETSSEAPDALEQYRQLYDFARDTIQVCG